MKLIHGWMHEGFDRYISALHFRLWLPVDVTLIPWYDSNSRWWRIDSM